MTTLPDFLTFQVAYFALWPLAILFVDQVTVGMTRSQVRYLLGTPMVSDPFAPQRWDYVYRLTHGRPRRTDSAHFIVRFEGDTVVVTDLQDDKGEAIAITADGKVIPECQLPKASADGKAAKDARPADPKAGKLPICPGTTNTTLTGVSQVTSISHVGSNCITYVICADGKCQFYTVCW